MTARAPELSATDRAALQRELARLPEQLPLTRADCARAVEQACRSSSLGFRTVLSRLLWLVDPAHTDGIRLLTDGARLDTEALARALVSPKGPVLDLIARRTGLAHAFLDRLYEAIVTHGDPGDYQKITDLSEERTLQEMHWWLTLLELPGYYLRNTPPELMARQITLNRFWELQGTGGTEYARMRVSSVAPDGSAMHWVHRSRSLEVEEEIERAYYAGDRRLNVAAFAPRADLLLYLVNLDPGAPDASTFAEAAPPSFLRITEEEAQRRYEEVWNSVRSSGSFAVAQSEKPETGEHRAMIGFPRGTINHFAANISRVMARAGIVPTRTYTVAFGGRPPVIIASLYARQPFPADLLAQLVEVSLYPPGAGAALVERGALTPAEANFLHAMAAFVHGFITEPDANIGLLAERFRTDRELAAILATIQRRLDSDYFTQAMIEGVFHQWPEIVHDLFLLFQARLDPASGVERLGEREVRGLLDCAIEAARLAADERQVVQWGTRFVEAVERTNFFLPVKSALSFRLDPAMLPVSSLGTVPFGVFFLVGRDFQGFHVRFTDIARGGIRLLASATHDDYLRNADSLFEECFSLAFTQNKKNKDIPEGGAKGIILPSFGSSRAEGEQAFHRYIDALLDLLAPSDPAAITGWKEEILFLGPDEGTAHLMDWACRRARERGYRFWKAFTTGKDASLGGISHKEFGITTQGVHRYVLGILRKLGIAEESITKSQTGGPDGDLGSNEILISRDRTVALVDGGGVLYDPAGLDRAELGRLAKAELDSSRFDERCLGPDGFKVGVADRDRTLPDGTTVSSGLGFRNTFHLDPRMRADLFVPCGGRPKSINLTNWRSLLDTEGRPLFRWIVEGANLFLTQEARLKLEERGVVVFKDSSTNKGGVISSALEVLAGLALSDEEYLRLMTVGEGGAVPDFRRRYVEETLGIVARRADQEFELLWRTHEATRQPLAELSEAVSAKIIEITRAIADSPLFDNAAIRRSAMELHVPPVLREAVGIEALERRVPPAYQRAIVARAVASAFVYRHGVSAGFEDYRRFIEELARGAAEPAAEAGSPVP
jgi:glutamate dehydrogenase